MTEAKQEHLEGKMLDTVNHLKCVGRLAMEWEER